jgi:hypothetical protein
MKQMLLLGLAAILVSVMVGVPAQAQLTPYSQDFEGMTWDDPNALMDDSWYVFGNVWGPDWGYWYGYWAVAPNQTAGFSSVAVGEGGPDQGAQQLVTYSDYHNGNHWDGSGANIEANFFQEYVITAADVGTTWRFEFDVRSGDIAGGTTATAFFKLVNTTTWAVTVIPLDVTNTPVWTRQSLDIYIDPSLEDLLLQFGFANMSSGAAFSGMFYDNINFGIAPVQVGFDVKPESCPNPVNTWSQGVIPTAIMGTADFDVLDIDIATLSLEGVAPQHVAFEDAGSAASTASWCGCSTNGQDGITDIILQFDTQDVIDALGGTIDAGTHALKLNGSLLDGTPIEGVDCIVAKGPRKVAPAYRIERGKATRSDRGGVDIDLRYQDD